MQYFIKNNQRTWENKFLSNLITKETEVIFQHFRITKFVQKGVVQTSPVPALCHPATVNHLPYQVAQGGPRGARLPAQGVFQHIYGNLQKIH